MLNVDMSLVFDLGNGLIVDPVTGEVSCTVSTCPASPLLGLTVEYSQNNQKWVEDFRDAFTKLTSVGCAGVCTQL